MRRVTKRRLQLMQAEGCVAPVWLRWEWKVAFIENQLIVKFDMQLKHRSMFRQALRLLHKLRQLEAWDAGRTQRQQWAQSRTKQQAQS